MDWETIKQRVRDPEQSVRRVDVLALIVEVQRLEAVIEQLTTKPQEPDDD